MKNQTRGFWVYSAPAIFYGLLIVAATATPGSYVPSLGITGLDKIVHFAMHFIFAMLVHRALLFQLNASFIKKKSLLLTVIGVAIFGIVVEWYQIYIPGRHADIGDGIANILGVLTYPFVYFLGLSKIWPEKRDWFDGN